MQIIRNFKRYEPASSTINDALLRHGVIFFISEDGQDWYDVQKLFQPDTLKIAYDDKGVIRSLSQDVSMLYPEGLSVAEVSNTAANRRADISGEWCFNEGEILRRQYSDEELQQQAEHEKQRLLAIANNVMAPLQDAVDLNEATQEECARLTAWKKFRIEVNRVDTRVPPVTFPALPE